jgi:hypothetical protein
MSAIRSPAFERALRQLGRALTALENYAEDLLVIGGMVPVLWRYAPTLTSQSLPDVATTELDMSVPPKLPVRTSGIRERLEGADFVAFERPGYRNEPGAVCFQDRNAEVEAGKRSSTYLEFLAPLRGKGDRPVVQVQPGLRAEALRYLDLLAFEPLTIELQNAPELALSKPIRVRVPQPGTFAVQKILARSSGRLSQPEKAAKDLAYVYLAARVCRPQRQAQRELFERAALHCAEWKTWLQRAEREMSALYASPICPGPVEAGRIYRDVMGDEAPRDEEIQRVVANFAATVLPR